MTNKELTKEYNGLIKDNQDILEEKMANHAPKPIKRFKTVAEGKRRVVALIDLIADLSDKKREEKAEAIPGEAEASEEILLLIDFSIYRKDGRTLMPTPTLRAFAREVQARGLERSFYMKQVTDLSFNMGTAKTQWQMAKKI